jgi:hypothetical protein
LKSIVNVVVLCAKDENDEKSKLNKSDAKRSIT